MNIAEIEMQLADLVKEPFDPCEFPFAFMEIFNAPKATITKLRNGTQNKADLVGDVLWQRKFYYRTAQPGQAALTVDVLRERKPSKTNRPRFIIATDGRELSALDTKADELLHCDFAKLNDHFDFFLPLAGIDKYQAVEENPADIKAAGRLAKFHDEIMRANPDWNSPEKRHALNQFMTRVLFCLFAEDTGSIKESLFVKTITEFGGENAEQLQSLLKQIFDIMNVPESDRSGVPAHINAFPYVNGGLFSEQSDVPAFSKRAKRTLIEAAGLDWREINPDIFGSMIQAVVDEEMRGDLGLHYTSVPNIMKVLQPLFLMSLEEEFDRARGHREERSILKRLLRRISKIRVFDPACGSGNFLIIAYRELRTLEMRIYQREDELNGGQQQHRWESGVKLSSFYGIEMADFAAETAKLSLWIAEYQMNQRFKHLFGEGPADFPLKEGGHIVHGNALRVDWSEACPVATKTVQRTKVFDLATIMPVHGTEEVEDQEAETYVVGNPPYLGSTWQNDLQKEEITDIFSPLTKSYKNLDYVAGWYLKASIFCAARNAQCAFVSTNSICQGEQVAMLWPLIFERSCEISFAHTSFKWKNNASNNAGVTCAIVGIRLKTAAPKRIFSNDVSRVVWNIGPYLIEMPDIVVKKSSKPLNGLPKMDWGNKATDDGNFILSPSDRERLLDEYPEAEKFVRRYYGSQEFIKGIERYCIWITEGELQEALQIAPIRCRIEAVEQFRAGSIAESTREFAKFPYRFRQIQGCGVDAVFVPRISSERRPYIPAGFMSERDIINDQAYAIYGAEPYVFSIISSRLHYAWISTVCGQMETRIRYSNTMGFHTFPVPNLNENHREKLAEFAWAVIGSRESHPGKSIAWLYDPDTMPDDLLEAHTALDDMLEKIYIGRPFRSDMERLEHLFERYAELTAHQREEMAHA